MKRTGYVFLLITIISMMSDETYGQCKAPTSQIDLDIANVRARIFNSDDMWWDLVGNPRYEVPKGSGKHSLFAGALWIGGIDHISRNLKVASQMYRSSGVDFWPGPMKGCSPYADSTVCSYFDRTWKINRQDVVNFIGGSQPTADMISYPGNGDALFPGYGHFLAPFYDKNGDGIYNTTDGDYPLFDYINPSCNCNEYTTLHGDQVIWWVINDVGNIHGNSHSPNPVGVEIQCQAFAYSSNDSDINNTTFYQYKIINRNCTSSLDSSYIGFFTDPDLGNPADDYIGCDVSRSLGFCYNADDVDDGPLGYGMDPPAVGIDFLKGPFADMGDGEDNDRDSCIDCSTYKCNGSPVQIADSIFSVCFYSTCADTIFGREHIAMSRFIYINNDNNPQNGNPNTSQDYYNYMKGIWRDGTPMNYDGKNGIGNGPACRFLYPGDSDPYGWGTYGTITSVNTPGWIWNEETAQNMSGDRRFLMSSGAFSLQPGAVQYFSMAAIWARASSGGRLASVAKLKSVDDKVQLLADNCFKISSLVGVESITKPEAYVYPNPVHDFLFIKLNQPMQDASINIYELTGRLIKTQLQFTGNQFSISCKGFAKGVYFYRIVLKDNKSVAGRFVKE